MSANPPTTSGSPAGADRCRLCRRLWSVPGIRRSLAYQVALLGALALALPLTLACMLLLGFEAGLLVALPVAVAVTAAGMLLLILGLRCLVQPIRDVRSMFHRFRAGEAPRAPGYFVYGELGELAGEGVQTLREIHARLQKTAERDAATDTLNPHGLKTELDWLLARRYASGTVALALFRLEDFRQWQLGLGVDALHAVECAVVDRLRGYCRWDDAVAVLGQGRFAVGLASRPAGEIEDLLARLRAGLDRPIESDGRRLRTGHTVGIARARHTDTATSLLEAAEGALETAAENGNGVASVDADNHSDTGRESVHLAMDLDTALEREEFFAEFQPRVDLASRAWLGAEALARWRHPEHGVLAPARFIPLAERHGRVARIGDAMLTRALAAARRWQDAGRPLKVSVNVASEQLTRRTLADDVAAALQHHRVVADQLELELTESSLLVDLEGAIEQLAACRDMGVQVSLDDFGTGYSSLAYLDRLPITRLKIDMSFVQAVDTARGRSIVRAILDLARGFDLATTAEGIETEEQAAALGHMGCAEGQGFLFARPMSDQAVLAALRESPARHGTFA